MTQIEALEDNDFDWVIALGNANQQETGPLNQAILKGLVDETYLAQVIRPDLGFLITFIETADYSSPNFIWFKQAMRNFVYVDRIVVAEQARGQGLARNFYENLFEIAAARGFERVVCEVNSDPPNPVSDKFHAALGFIPVGSATLPNKKTVTYLSRTLKV